MNLSTTLGSTPKTPILAVGGSPRDLSMLRCLFMGSSWELSTSRSLEEAGQLLQGNTFPVVICQNELPDGSWKDLLRITHLLDHPPSVIVVSRHHDDALWTEALNSGAFDVLTGSAKQGSVFRTLNNAWRSWKHRRSQVCALA